MESLPRSPQWPRVERAHLKKQPHCVCCKPGTNTHGGLQVHHMFPFHYCVALGRPDSSSSTVATSSPSARTSRASPARTTTCWWGTWTTSGRRTSTCSIDARITFFGMTAAAIRADARWKAKAQRRLAPLDAMSHADKAAFVDRMNRRFPRRERPSRSP